MPPTRSDLARDGSPLPVETASLLPPGMAEAPAAFLSPLRAAPPPQIPRQLDLPLPADPLADPPDPHLLARIGPAFALRHGLLPWRRRGGDILILTASPQDYARQAAFLAALFGPTVRPLPCPRPLIEAALLAHAGRGLATAAERRAPAIASCRSFDRLTVTAACATLATATAAIAILAPKPFLLALFALSILALLATTALKSTAALAAAFAHDEPSQPPPAIEDGDLPSISLLICLYGEEDIAPRLLRRLEALDYPRDRLELLLLTEETDTATRAALTAASLPAWMRILSIPDGRIRTKPRALNFGLDFARGSLIGVYDAEDAPAPDQLRTVAARFAAAPPRVACLQGALDFYNPTTNWIARCFTMEYAVWFRLILPGLERLGLPIPLGGTTLFLRREVLADIGGWDAHNVTEDADLGLRLARRGWETRILPSTTLEEANCNPVAWVKQRSRWTKGYLMTWLVHMRDPAALWRDLGARRFLGVQVLVLGTLMQVMLSPLQWTFLLHPPAPGHPLADALPPLAVAGIVCLCVFSQLAGYAITAVALRLAGHPPQWHWLPLSAPYFLLATFAGFKALAESLTRPFHWDKTRHGRHGPEQADP